MDELLSLLETFRESMQSQIKILSQLVPILDREEDLLARFDLNDFEKTVIEKDQLAKRTQVIEDRRAVVLRKICYLISYDARGQLPTLRTFRLIFKNYLEKVESLILPETFVSLKEKESAIAETEQRFRELFSFTAPRVYRNQVILKKLLKNFKLSISLLQTEVVKDQNYDKSGKAISKPASSDSWSSVRIKA